MYKLTDDGKSSSDLNNRLLERSVWSRISLRFRYVLLRSPIGRDDSGSHRDVLVSNPI